MTDHEHIWLEPDPGNDPEGRMWCQDNVFDGGGIEFIRADIVAVQLAEARDKALEEAAAWHDTQAARYPASWKRKIAMHDISAAAIRAMKEAK